MHVTAAEAALGVGVITAAAGWLGSRGAQRATQAREHFTRLWEQRSAAYEAVLMYIAQTGHTREKFMEERNSIKRAEYIQLEGDALDARLSLLTRLYMYGSVGINKAFRTWTDADKAWRSAFTDMCNTSETDDVDAWTKARQRARDTAKVAKYTEVTLIGNIAFAIQNAPERTGRFRKMTL